MRGSSVRNHLNDRLRKGTLLSCVAFACLIGLLLITSELQRFDVFIPQTVIMAATSALFIVFFFINFWTRFLLIHCPACNRNLSDLVPGGRFLLRHNSIPDDIKCCPHCGLDFDEDLQKEYQPRNNSITPRPEGPARAPKQHLEPGSIRAFLHWRFRKALALSLASLGAFAVGLVCAFQFGRPGAILFVLTMTLLFVAVTWGQFFALRCPNCDINLNGPVPFQLARSTSIPWNVKHCPGCRISLESSLPAKQA